MKSSRDSLNKRSLRRPERRDMAALLLIFFGAMIIIIGVDSGEVQILWQKAIRICLECIGIG